jgi:hypothetical protein
MNSHLKRWLKASRVVCLTSLLACSAGEQLPLQDPSRANGELAPASSPRNSVTQDQANFCLSKFPNMETAWENFTADGHYRMAARQDFDLPQSVMDNQGASIKPIDAPCMIGQLRGQDSGTEFAAIVVDNRRTDPSRFGIVFFHGLEHERVSPKPFWLKQNEDLSRSMLNKISSNLVVTTYGLDGSIETCVVTWHPDSQKYSCIRKT